MDQQQQGQTSSQPPPAAGTPGDGLALDMALLWVENNRNKILAGILVIGLAGLALVVYSNQAQSRQHEAAAALFRLQATAVATPTAEDFRRVASETQGTTIEQHARVREAATLFIDGKFAQALSVYEAFAVDFPASPLLPEAGFGAAACLEALGRDAEALTRYQQFATRFPQSALVNRARLAVARLQEKAGDQQQAFRVYQELASQSGASAAFGQRSPLQMEAALAVRRLMTENPALVQTNPPAAPLSGPLPFNVTPQPVTAPASGQE